MTQEYMTLPEMLEQIAKTACPKYAWYYDIRQMQNVTADDCAFPAIYMEEYYADRTLRRAYDKVREVTIEIHFLDLVPMQGVAIEREKVREVLRREGVDAFMAAYNEYALANGLREVEEYQCDPEPPMFDANATGVLLRFDAVIPLCFTPTPPAEDSGTQSEQTSENDETENE